MNFPYHQNDNIKGIVSQYMAAAKAGTLSSEEHGPMHSLAEVVAGCRQYPNNLKTAVSICCAGATYAEDLQEKALYANLLETLVPVKSLSAVDMGDQMLSYIGAFRATGDALVAQRKSFMSSEGQKKDIERELANAEYSATALRCYRRALAGYDLIQSKLDGEGKALYRDFVQTVADEIFIVAEQGKDLQQLAAPDQQQAKRVLDVKKDCFAAVATFPKDMPYIPQRQPHRATALEALFEKWA